MQLQNVETILSLIKNKGEQGLYKKFSFNYVSIRRICCFVVLESSFIHLFT